MRVPPPGTLKLDRDLLLEDVRERLAERLPQYASGEDDPTDPGWLLLEQAAWLVELHSAQLDRYPYSVVQYFVHMMGGQLKPAHPALAVVVAQVLTEGQIRIDPRFPSPYRFFSSQTEERDAVEFVPIESLVDLRLARVASIAEVRHGELFVIAEDARGEGDLEGHVVWRGAERASRMFEAETARYVVVTATPDKTLEDLQDAIRRLDERNLGWLELSAEQIDSDKVAVVAAVNLALAFRNTVEGGLCPGGDVEGEWGALDDSTWTPQVTLAHHPLLPPRLRGSRPMPGVEEGRIVLPDIPMNFPVEELLVRRAEPLPGVVVEGIWETLANANARLASLRPRIERGFGTADGNDEGEPTWLRGALESGLWDRLCRGERQTVFHVEVETPHPRPSRLRVALVLGPGAARDLPPIDVFGVDANGRVTPAPLQHTVAWKLPLPSRRGGQAMDLVVALDIQVEGGLQGLLVTCRGDVRGLFLNALLVANMATVRDGRLVTVTRNVPEPVSLLHEDIVTDAVVTQLLEQAIPDDTAAIVRNFPIAWFDVEDGEPIANWEGVGVDPGSGILTVNAPDEQGEQRAFRLGDQIRLEWYRRTDGAWGDVGPGEIELVEEAPNAEPSLFAVRNPLGAFYGADRESPESAIDRMFAPSQGTPVLAADYERVVRQALGSRAQRWNVRVWTYAERSLLSTAVWPVADSTEALDPETSRLLRELPRQGPSTLLVAVGPAEGQMTADDLDWARKVIRKTIKQLSRRNPTVRDAMVTRLWPLTLHAVSEEAADEVVTPSHDLAAMQGRLVDQYGRSAAPPQADLLLNGVVTDVVVDGP